MISLIQLEYIVAVDTYRHFARAAEHCFVTQPTLSMQIKKLEDYYEAKIFDRTKQPVIPTEFGKKVIDRARKILHQAHQLDEIAKNFSGKVEGRFRIGVIPTLAPYLIPLFIGKLHKNYPDLDIEIEELKTNEIIRALKKDVIDCGILVTPLHDNEIKESVLFYESLFTFSNEFHPLYNQKKVRIGDLQNYGLWLLSEGNCFRNQVLNLCKGSNQNQENNIKYESGSINTLLKIINQEGGYTVIPELAAKEYKNQKQVSSIEEGNYVREVSVVYLRDYYKKMAIEALSDIIQDKLPKSMVNKNEREIVEWI